MIDDGPNHDPFVGGGRSGARKNDVLSKLEASRMSLLYAVGLTRTQREQ